MLSATTIAQALHKAQFTAYGFAPALPIEEWRKNSVKQWLAKGYNGNMEYLTRHYDMRCDPRLVVEGAKTVVSVALNYYPQKLQPKNTLQFAKYAYGKDYHDIVKNKLHHIMQELQLNGRAFCDTAPIDEHYWAWRCGLGWLGRNTQLIIPKAGSYYFLGEMIITDEVDAYNEPQKNRCGTCQQCKNACPTHAIIGNGEIDARKCLSYLTIENKEDLPEGVSQQMENCIYGCDKCLEACPWNRFAKPNQVDEFVPSDEFMQMLTNDWYDLTIEKYQKIFKGSAVKRAKYEGLIRNINAIKNKS